MHETETAKKILRLVAEEFNNYPGATRVTQVKVKVGKLNAHDLEELQFCFQLVSKGTPAQDASLLIEEVEPRFLCQSCGHEFEISVPSPEAEPSRPQPVSSCPSCSSSDLTLLSGKELTLVSIETL